MSAQPNPAAYGERVLVCRLDELPEVGSAAAVSLAEGELDGCTLECWLHGSRFDLLTGDPSGPPATVPVAVHHVTIEGDDVYVALKEN